MVASVVRAMLLVAYLDLPSVAHRRVSETDNALLIPMVTQSDNAPAMTVVGIAATTGCRHSHTMSV
jgi:hypothetical protein